LLTFDIALCSQLARFLVRAIWLLLLLLPKAERLRKEKVPFSHDSPVWLALVAHFFRLLARLMFVICHVSESTAEVMTRSLSSIIFRGPAVRVATLGRAAAAAPYFIRGDEKKGLSSPVARVF